MKKYFTIPLIIIAFSIPVGATDLIVKDYGGNILEPLGQKRAFHPDISLYFNTSDVVAYCFPLPEFPEFTQSIVRIGQEFFALNGNGRSHFVGKTVVWNGEEFDVSDYPNDEKIGFIISELIPVGNQACKMN